ncbi:hypothetical protein AOLI_G00195220 [Acnodon oligacanthus]
MSQNIYDDVISIEELNRGHRAEVVVDIYESADTVRRHDPNPEMEATNSKRKAEILNTGGDTAQSRCSRLAAVCLGLLCVLLLAASTVLWIKLNNLTAERDQFWWRGEPNDYEGKEDCAITGYRGAGSDGVSTWADYPCNYPVTGICEKRFN